MVAFRVERKNSFCGKHAGTVRDAPLWNFPKGFAGNASLRKKTLHRLLNDLIDSWEATGVREFILLTAHEHDPHLEALSTVITSGARVRVVEIDLGDDQCKRSVTHGSARAAHILKVLGITDLDPAAVRDPKRAA